MTTHESLFRLPRAEPRGLTDAELLIEVKRLAAAEREATADLIRSLCEVEARQLHLAIGCSSMFGYCTQVLHLSEHAAYARIAAARAAARFPLVMDLLSDGAITLTTVTLLGRHLTSENHVAVLESARHKSKADVEMLVAALHPQSVDSSRPALVRAVAPERYTLQVTISDETYAKLRRAQDLLWHSDPRMDEGTIIDRALTLLVERLEKTKFGRTNRPRRASQCDSASRYVSAHLRRAVSERDGYQCAFVGVEGRCSETAGLEYHHRVPFADGGLTTVDNLELRCRAHNVYEAGRWFGPLTVREVASEWGQLGLDQVARDGSRFASPRAFVRHAWPAS